MEITQCKVRDLTPEDKRRCGYLSYRSDGDLWYWLREYPDADVIVVKEDGKILGWAVRTPYGETGYYVRKTHRRQGIGSKMYYLLNNRRQRSAVVKPHNPSSASFFYSLGRIKKEEAVNWYGAPKDIKRKPRRLVMSD